MISAEEARSRLDVIVGQERNEANKKIEDRIIACIESRRCSSDITDLIPDGAHNRFVTILEAQGYKVDLRENPKDGLTFNISW